MPVEYHKRNFTLRVRVPLNQSLELPPFFRSLFCCLGKVTGLWEFPSIKSFRNRFFCVLVVRCYSANIEGRTYRFLYKKSSKETYGDTLPWENCAALPLGVGLVSTACIG